MSQQIKTCLWIAAAYPVAQWLHFYTLSLQYVSCTAQPAYHRSFPDVGLTLLQRTFCLNEKETKKASVYLDDNLRPQVKN